MFCTRMTRLMQPPEPRVAKIGASRMGYRVAMTTSSEIHDILHPAVEELEDKHADEGDAMYMLGRMVVAVEHLAKRMDELNTTGHSHS